MMDGVIEIAPEHDGWAVCFSRQVQGAFPAAAQAVAFARRLSDDLARQGSEPRIRVYLQARAQGTA